MMRHTCDDRREHGCPSCWQDGRDRGFDECVKAMGANIAKRDERIEKLESVLAMAHECFNGQHNLLSTATDEQRTRVVTNFLDWWNNKARIALEAV